PAPSRRPWAGAASAPPGPYSSCPLRRWMTSFPLLAAMPAQQAGVAGNPRSIEMLHGLKQHRDEAVPVDLQSHVHVGLHAGHAVKVHHGAPGGVFTLGLDNHSSEERRVGEECRLQCTAYQK